MRIIIALLAILVSFPVHAAVRHVNGATGSNSNDGLTSATAWATPSYAASQMAGGTSANHDTMYIYGYNIGDTANYYLDAISVGTKYIDFVGVYVDGKDSPTFDCRLATNAAFTINADAGSGIVFDGLRFINNNKTYAPIWHSYSQTGSIVRNCVFDSSTPGHLTESGFIGYDIKAGSNKTASISNCVFINSAQQCIAVNVLYGSNSGMDLTISNCSFRNDSCAVAYKFGSNYTGDSIAIKIVNSIINADTIAVMYTIGATTQSYLAGALILTNCDTYGVAIETQPIKSSTYNYGVSYTKIGCYSENPQWRDAIGSQDDWKCFMQNSTLSTGSTSGGVVGVMWGWSPSAAISTYRRVPFVTRWRQLLFGR